MAVRRLHKEQPDSFDFTPENAEWAKKKIAEYPDTRQASAVIPLLWVAQEQHQGWLPEPAIRLVADMLSMPYIRVLEVATFYTQFQLSPVGTTAHIQVCGTTPCRLRGADKIIAACKSRISPDQFTVSADGKFSWEEVECLGACVNAPMALIGRDTYEDLDEANFEALLNGFDKGTPPEPGPQNGRHFCVPATGLTTLTDESLYDGSRAKAVPAGLAGLNGSGGAASSVSDTSEVSAAKEAADAPKNPATQDAKAALDDQDRPVALTSPEAGGADDLKRISGVGPKLEGVLNSLGIFHFHQIAIWTRENVEWVDGYLRFKGRIDRDNWIEQAKTLADEKK